jgi:hypothetical protein
MAKRQRASTKKAPPAKTAAAKKKSPKQARPKRLVTLPALTGLARDLFTHVLNGIAFEQYGNCCAVDDLAKKLGKPPGRLQPAIRKLVEQGYVTVEGNIYPIIYPTTAALRQQNPKLGQDEAETILAKARRG